MTQAAPLQTSNAKPKQSDSTGLLLQRKCDCGSNASALTGECEECGEKSMLGLQTKLAISEPGDRYEQEADRIADTVMRMPVPAAQRQATGTEEREELLQAKPLSDRITPLVQSQAVVEEEEDDDEEKPLQTKRSGTQTPVVTSGVEASIQALRQSGGQPLDSTTRAFMEPRFGYDFSQVHIHTGPRAESAARSVNARAFTVGRDVVFGSGQYTPRTRDGQQLLAHELTHTLQQRASIARMPTTMQKKSALRRGLLSKGKRPRGFLGWWLRHGVPKGFKIVTARRVSRAKRLLSGEYDLTVEERKMLLDLVGRGGAKAAAETPAKGVTSRDEGETGHDEPVAESRNAPEAPREDESLLNGPYSTVEGAVNGFAKKYNEISKLKNEEVCSIIVKKGEQFFFLDGWQAIDKGERIHSCPSFPPSSHERRKPKNFAGEVHTHAGADPRYENERPSPHDRTGCSETRGPCFIITPSDRVIKYGPDPRAGSAPPPPIDLNRRRTLKVERDRNRAKGERVNLTGPSSPRMLTPEKTRCPKDGSVRFIGKGDPEVGIGGTPDVNVVTVDGQPYLEVKAKRFTAKSHVMTRAEDNVNVDMWNVGFHQTIQSDTTVILCYSKPDPNSDPRAPTSSFEPKTGMVTQHIGELAGGPVLDGDKGDLAPFINPPELAPLPSPSSGATVEMSDQPMTTVPIFFNDDIIEGACLTQVIRNFNAMAFVIAQRTTDLETCYINHMHWGFWQSVRPGAIAISVNGSVQADVGNFSMSHADFPIEIGVGKGLRPSALTPPFANVFGKEKKVRKLGSQCPPTGNGCVPDPRPKRPKP